jgi:hypothetical protein
MRVGYCAWGCFQSFCWGAAQDGLLTQKGPPRKAALWSHAWWCRLLRSLLLRWIECAGLVDFGDLVIREAEDGAQDLVGVLAE